MLLLLDPMLVPKRREISGVEGPLVLSCDIPKKIRYCYFRSPNSTIFNVNPGLCLFCIYRLTIKIKSLAILRKIHGTNFFHIKFLGRTNIKCQNEPVLPPAQVFYQWKGFTYISLMLYRDAHDLPKLLSCEEYCRRGKW
jgi:hypothetical protein